MTDRTAQVLDELERLAREATPGPWECPETRGYASNFVYKSGGMRRQICRTVAQASNDGRFIAALHPQRALELIAVARAASKLRSAMYDRDTADGPEQAVIDAFNGLGDALRKLSGDML